MGNIFSHGSGVGSHHFWRRRRRLKKKLLICCRGSYGEGPFIKYVTLKSAFFRPPLPPCHVCVTRPQYPPPFCDVATKNHKTRTSNFINSKNCYHFQKKKYSKNHLFYETRHVRRPHFLRRRLAEPLCVGGDWPKENLDRLSQVSRLADQRISK